MKSAKGRMFMGLAVTAVMVLTVLSVPAHAQSSALSVKIPFAFHVGQKTLPAGTYTVQKRTDAITLSDGEGHVAAVIANAVANPTAAAGDWLVFNRYEKDCFLTEVRWSGYSNALRLVKSPIELELAKAGATERALVAATR
jgi:Xaa-Pro aminopeptidase